MPSISIVSRVGCGGRREEEGGRMKGEGGRRKEEGGRGKEVVHLY
jgi:hypothetical protein